MTGGDHERRQAPGTEHCEVDPVQPKASRVRVVGREQGVVKGVHGQDLADVLKPAAMRPKVMMAGT